MNTFTINRETPVYLYGAAATGKFIYENLHSCNIDVTAFFDNRAEEIKTFLGRPVWSPKSISEGDKNAVVIISVKNVFEHEEIANSFIAEGYHQLIFMPAAVLNGKPDPGKAVIAKIYDALLEGGSFLDIEVPCTMTPDRYQISESGILSESDDQVTVLLPVTFLYTKNKAASATKWGNINLLAFFTHVSFFRYLAGEAGYDYREYVEEYCVYAATVFGQISITDAWKKNVVRNRAMIYHNMERNDSLDHNFFIRNAPTADYNYERGYFNLTSGKHRALFQIAKGRSFLPITISRKDYEYYRNREEAEKLEQLLQSEDVFFLDPIANPYYYKYPTKDYGYMDAVLSRLSYYLAKEIYAGHNIVDFSVMGIVCDAERYLPACRHYSRMGASILAAPVTEIEAAIRRLERIPGRHGENPADPEILVFIGNDFSEGKYNYDYLVTEKDSCPSGYHPDLVISGYSGGSCRELHVYKRDITG